MAESLTLFDDPAIEVADDPADEADAEPAARPVVEIRVSKRRRKWIAAHWEGDRIVVTVPAKTSKRERAAHAEELAARLIAERDRRRPSDEQLMQRALDLSRTYLDGQAEPAAVNWSSRQRWRWGSCSPGERTIRISDMLKDVPAWVLDAVVLHELVHLLHNNHGREFRALVERYPRAAEADAFLAGMEHGVRHATAR